jgi:hypothetical protein
MWDRLDEALVRADIAATAVPQSLLSVFNGKTY